jgi:hypothetical protein
MTKETVIVFINGFIIPSDKKPFDHSILPPNIRFISVTPSSTASLHDRCCHIFYELKGGCVNFGREHSDFHGHSQYGQFFREGLYPEWDENHPILFIGHSMGGITALALQKYLTEQKFIDAGFQTSANWISGVIAINSPFRGSLRVHSMAAYRVPMTEIDTFGYLFGGLIHLTEFLNVNWWRKYIFASRHQHWRMNFCNKKPFFSLFVFFLSVCGYGIHTNVDCLTYDASLDGMEVWNRYLELFPNSFYFAIVGNIAENKNNKTKENDKLLFTKESEDNNEEEDGHDSIPIKKPNYHDWKIFHRFLFLLRKFLQNEFELQTFPIKVNKKDTSHWLDDGHDGIIDVFTQSSPSFPKQEIINCWNQKELNKRVWESGKLYLTGVNSSHLAIIHHCPITWKIIWRMVSIIIDNSRTTQESDDQNVSLTPQFQLSRPKLSSVNKKPDLQEPHLHLHYHYHHRFCFVALVLFFPSFFSLFYFSPLKFSITAPFDPSTSSIPQSSTPQDHQVLLPVHHDYCYYYCCLYSHRDFLLRLLPWHRQSTNFATSPSDSVYSHWDSPRHS